MCVSFKDCIYCDGEGHLPEAIEEDCGVCRGTGQIKVDDEEYGRTPFQPEPSRVLTGI